MEVLSAAIFLQVVSLLAKAEENFHTTLTVGTKSGVHTTKCGEYGYFQVHVHHPCDDLNVLVKRREGEPNLYISRGPNKFPTYRSLAWSSYEWGSENLTISSWDPNFKPGIFYIAVHSYCGEDILTSFKDAEYTVLVQNIPHSHPRSEDLFNNTVTGIVKEKKYKHYRFCIPSECYKVEIRLENCIDPAECPTSYSWPELIVSPNVETPTEKSMAWILAEVEHRSIFLELDENIRSGHYYVGVYGWCTPTNHCPDKKQCGPCEYAKETRFNLSIIPIDTCSATTDSTPANGPSFMILIPQLVTLFITFIVLKDC